MYGKLKFSKHQVAEPHKVVPLENADMYVVWKIRREKFKKGCLNEKRVYMGEQPVTLQIVQR